MEHAIRHHITVNKAKDPAYYQQFSERLEEILQELGRTGTSRSSRSRAHHELKDDAPDNPHGLGPVEGAVPPPQPGMRRRDRIPDLLDATQDVYHRAAEVVHRRDFWHPSKETDREEFRSEICGILFDRRLATAQDVEARRRLFEVIKANRERIPRP